jgi:hypothetical protein
MTNYTSLLLAPSRRPPEDAHGTTVTAGWEAADPGNAGSPLRSRDGALDDVPGRRSGEVAISRQSALDIMGRAALSQADQIRLHTLPYPVEYHVFWQVLAKIGVNQERLMDRMGASP